MDSDTGRSSWRRWGGAAALAAAGAIAGGVLAGTLTANADNSASTSSPAAAQRLGQAIDESRSIRPDEQLLSGDTANKVRAAALAKYPGATVLRVETDSDGVYEAHLRTTDGQRVTVEVNRQFEVTGTEVGRHGMRPDPNAQYGTGT